jgi:tetratricopeptide (TPR) repeat protein
VPSRDVASGLDALNRLCRETIERRDYDEAQRVCKRISFDAEKMAPGSQAHITSLLNMGDIKARVENFVDADAYYTAALRVAERTLGAGSPAAAEILTALVEFKVRRGKYLDAAELAKRSLAIRERNVGPSDVGLAIVRARYADLLSQSHQFLQAEAVYRRALAVLEQSGAQHAEAFARTVQHLGEMYERRALYQQAEQQYRRLVAIAERNGLDFRLLAGAFDRLAYVCEQQDKVAEAAMFYRRAMTTLSGTPTQPEIVARLQSQLAALEATQVQGTQ